MRVLDLHTHPVYVRSGWTMERVPEIISRGRALGIVRMVVLGDVLRHGGAPTEEQVTAINDDTAALQREHPDYFTGFCFLNPTLGERAVHREVERCANVHGFSGIKLEICNNAREDRWMRPVMEAARRWRLPVLQHSWSMANLGPRKRKLHSDPIDTALLARRYPDVTVIMAHLTGCEVRGVLEVKALPNVVVDTSGAPAAAGIIEYAVEQLGPDRVLYGSDLPGRSPEVAIARITGANLSAADRRKVLFENADRLLARAGVGRSLS